MKKPLLFVSMLAFCGLSYGQVALSENFEGETFPPTGWTIESTNSDPDYTWILVGGTDAISGNQSAAVNWDDAEESNESLISPSFSLAGYTTAYFNFTAATGYAYMVDPNNNGNIYAEVSSNGGSSWTEVWVEDDEDVFTDLQLLNKRINISQFAGQTDVMVRFRYEAFDADVVIIDDISVTACEPISGVTLNELADGSASFTIEGEGASYSVEYGAVGFVQGTGTVINGGADFSIDNLAEGTGYSFYVTSNCGTGTANSGWEGPYNFYTPLYAPANLPYSFGFETPTLATGGWFTELVNEDGATWGAYQGGEDLLPQEGELFAGAIGIGGEADAYLFSRGLNLVGGTDVNLSYYVREFALDASGNGNENYLTVKIGTDRTSASQTTTIVDLEEITDEEFTQRTATFQVPTSGIYYIAFEVTGPANTGTEQGALLLDAVTVTGQSAGVQGNNAAAFAVFPNPANNVVNVANAVALISNVKIADLNGRTVKTVNFENVGEAQINIADLASGVYMMTIASDKGTTTKKIVKN